MKLLSTLALIPAVALAGDSPGGKFNWLAGCWETTDSRAIEVWVVDSDRSLIGFSVTINDDEVGFYEVMSIKQSVNGSWEFTAHPSGQAAATFLAVEITDNSVIFSNPEHDYPQEIRYAREGGRLLASISLLGGDKPNSFDKVACR